MCYAAAYVSRPLPLTDRSSREVWCSGCSRLAASSPTSFLNHESGVSPVNLFRFFVVGSQSEDVHRLEPHNTVLCNCTKIVSYIWATQEHLVTLNLIVAMHPPCQCTYDDRGDSFSVTLVHEEFDIIRISFFLFPFWRTLPSSVHLRAINWDPSILM